MKLTPEVSVLDSVRGQYGLSWPKLLGELIDNALDAEAKEIRIDLGHKGRVEVCDDGRGCPDLSRMLVLGRRKDHGRGGATGRYGIGAKDAIIGLGDQVQIVSTCEGVTRSVKVHWRRLRESGLWECPDPDEAHADEPPGTRVVISELHKTPPTRQLLCSLGACYAPAIASGTRLLVRLGRRGFEPVLSAAAVPLDPCRSNVRYVFGPGREVVATAGLISDPGMGGQDGVTVTLEGYRVVTARTRIGLDGPPAPGFYAMLELRGKGWAVAKNKDELSDHDREALAAFVAGTFGDLIAESRRRGTQLTIDGLNEFFTALTDHNRRGKAVRSRPTEHPGAVEPTGAGRKHGRAARTQPGDTFPLPGRDELTGHMWVELHPLGAAPLFESHGTSQVVVNMDHPAYPVLFGPGRERQLAVAVLCYYASQAVLRGWRQQLPLPFRELDQDRAEMVAGTLSDYLRIYAETAAAARETA